MKYAQIINTQFDKISQIECTRITRSQKEKTMITSKSPQHQIPLQDKLPKGNQNFDLSTIA